MQHYVVLSRGNFCAKEQHSNKVLTFGTRGPVFMPHRVDVDVTSDGQKLTKKLPTNSLTNFFSYGTAII